MKNQQPGQQSGNRPKKPAEPTEQRRRALRRTSKRVAGRAVRLAEDVALKGASTSLRVARLVVRRLARANGGGTRRKRISVD